MIPSILAKFKIQIVWRMQFLLALVKKYFFYGGIKS